MLQTISEKNVLDLARLTCLHRQVHVDHPMLGEEKAISQLPLNFQPVYISGCWL